MNTIGQKERATQNCVVRLFRDALGYTYLGNWEERAGNSNIEADFVRVYLARQGVSPSLIDRVLHEWIGSRFAAVQAPTE